MGNVHVLAEVASFVWPVLRLSFPDAGSGEGGRRGGETQRPGGGAVGPPAASDERVRLSCPLPVPRWLDRALVWLNLLPGSNQPVHSFETKVSLTFMHIF